MGTHHRGFIPLVAVLLIGLVAVAGGVGATIYVRGEAGAQKEMPQEGADLVPGSSQVATSSAAEAPGVPETKKVLVEEPVLETGIGLTAESKKPNLRADTQRICVEAKQIPLPLPKEDTDELDAQTAELIDQQAVARNSLIGHVHLLCDELLAGAFQDEEDLRETEQALREKWTLWLQTRGNTR